MSETLKKYINGEHIHIGSPLDCFKTPEEREAQDRECMRILGEIVAHEIKQGNITIDANGLYVFGEGVVERLPKVRDDTNQWCCISEEDKNFYLQHC